MNKKLVFLFIIAVLVVVFFVFFRFNNGESTIVSRLSNGGAPLLPLVSVAALIDSINPCAFSILILTVAFLFSIGKMRSKIFSIGAFYIFGIFMVYILIGLGILGTLSVFNIPHFMAKVGAIILIIFGLINLINEFFPAFPIKLKIPHIAHPKIAELMNKASSPASFLLGVFVGLFEFPCTGGPYLVVLGLLHDGATYLKGFGYLVLYNIIFILPLIVILLIASDKKLVEKIQTWRKSETGRMRLWNGLAMIVLGILIFAL